MVVFTHHHHDIRSDAWGYAGFLFFTDNNQGKGTFAIYYTEPRKPTPHDLQLIDEIVELTAVAIESRKERF
jgi:hypothetical protein